MYEQDPSNDTLTYYLGLSYLEDSEELNALPYLNEVAVDKQSVFSQRAQWYQAMAHLLNNNLIEAKKSFTAITQDQNHEFYPRALEAISKIEALE